MLAPLFFYSQVVSYELVLRVPLDKLLVMVQDFLNRVGPWLEVLLVDIHKT